MGNEVSKSNGGFFLTKKHCRLSRRRDYHITNTNYQNFCREFSTAVELPIFSFLPSVECFFAVFHNFFLTVPRGSCFEGDDHPSAKNITACGYSSISAARNKEERQLQEIRKQEQVRRQELIRRQEDIKRQEQIRRQEEIRREEEFRRQEEVRRQAEIRRQQQEAALRAEQQRITEAERIRLEQQSAQFSQGGVNRGSVKDLFGIGLEISQANQDQEVLNIKLPGRESGRIG